MTNATHTPGPWKAYESAAPDYPATVAYTDGADEITICDVTEAGGANARLIAAAPDLLAALEASPQLDCHHKYHNTACWPCMARAAIAKATGV